MSAYMESIKVYSIRQLIWYCITITIDWTNFNNYHYLRIKEVRTCNEERVFDDRGSVDQVWIEDSLQHFR